MFENVPLEMRLFAQWVVWRYEDTESAKPTKVPYSARTNRLASVTDSATWATFDEAVHAATNGNGWYSGIGFVLTDNDPFAFIDLDDTKGDQGALDRQIKVYNEFDSFAERSPSGSGLHIIVKGSIPSGRRRSFIEVYSSQRYMTMTGDVYRAAPIRDCNEALNALWAQMGQGSVATAVYAGVAEEKETDDVIIQRATAAANGDKFAALLAGNWQDYYPSRSEADFALVDIVAFYTQNRGQIARIFRNSGLGQRDKAKRTDYVNYMLNKCFDRMLPPVDIDGLRNQINEAIEAKERAEQTAQPMAAAQPATTQAASIPEAPNNVYSVPPGLVGEVARFIYAQAPRPVPEIALAGALGLIAGIVGRAYNISGTGLNQYVLLLAPTGTGKEAIAGGIDKLMSAVLRTVPASAEFVGPAKISSEQALIKHLSKVSTSFVSVVGEFGIQLKLMASPYAAPHMQGLLSSFLDLFNKSGEGKVLRPSIYSDREKNTSSVLAPAVSIIGESTPEKFYEALDETMISSGLLPRFTMIEYHGERPPLNANHIYAQPSFDVIEKLSTLCAHSLMLNSQHKAIHVQTAPDAKTLFDQFDVHCDMNINTSDKEVRRHLWNRAHIKALKLAALVAVGNNPYDPLITVDVATWATNLIVADVRNMLARFDAGEIGVDNDETKQLNEVIRVVRDYMVKPWSEVQKYSTSPALLHNERILPFSYVSRRLAAVAIFRKDKRGASKAIEIAIKTLCDRGDLQEVSRATLSKTYGTTAKCYMVATPKVFGL